MSRLEKLEFKVEGVDNKLDEVKEELVEARLDVQEYSREVTSHIERKRKAINEIIATLLMFQAETEEVILGRTVAQARGVKSTKVNSKGMQRILILGGVLIFVVTILAGVYFKLFSA